MRGVWKGRNRGGISSAEPGGGKTQRWGPTSRRAIFVEETYRGVGGWGKTKKLHSPETGKRIYRRRPSSEWRRVEIPEQRIVSEESWNRTHERLTLVQELFGLREGKGRGRGAASPYVFTGLLVCSECGGSIPIVSGRCRKREDSRYGCSRHAQRGDSVCKNALLVRRLELERQLLAGLEERVWHPEVVDYTLTRFEEQLGKAHAARGQGNSDLRRQATDLERSIANQLRGLSDGYSVAITEEIAKLEGQLATVRERIKASNPSTLKLQMRDTPRLVETRLRNLSALWDGEPRIVREEIAKHVQNITLKPVCRTYIATGIWDWLGVLGGAAAIGVPRARPVHNSPSPSIAFQIYGAA